MKKKPKAPSFEEFRTRFLRLLESYYTAEPLIPDILKDEALKKQCAGMLWFCVDPKANLPEISKNWRSYWNPKFEDAIRGVDAAVDIYTDFDSKPFRARFLSKLRADLLEKQQGRAVLPAKLLGRDRDWTPVLQAKSALEFILRRHVPNRSIAALLNAASRAGGQERKFSAEAIQRALTRLRTRLLQK